MEKPNTLIFWRSSSVSAKSATTGRFARIALNKLMDMLDEHKVVPLTPDNVKALQDMLQIQIESQELCAICLDNLEEPVITACAHLPRLH